MPVLTSPDSSLPITHEDEIPFRWRGRVNDALYQASQATCPDQITKLRRSIIRFFILSLSLPVCSLILVSLAIFFSTGFQFYACFIVLIFLSFLIFYRILWLRRILKAIHNPDQFYVPDPSHVIVVQHEEVPESLPPPPPTYEVAHRSPPSYELYKLMNIPSLSNRTTIDPIPILGDNVPSYENINLNTSRATQPTSYINTNDTTSPSNTQHPNITVLSISTTDTYINESASSLANTNELPSANHIATDISPPCQLHIITNQHR